ncbi:nuclear transport factor 2 family protein [Plasticicumulans acidivorans]|uniref:Steroid delta-isomerase-like uncharacterized protein n=1 Tax=Plasticicumulans acidivorans TaxID=886464 RepID=A0A317MYC6_9GAMM|nr:nuclear transport factor 2 family protein [Plasticicumulans acidivorans]PWV64623.1 steroid delta-isomerase-like uncharacterized protein [Plasticicumulans acidivorans]
MNAPTQGLIERLYAALNARDYESVRELLGSEFVYSDSAECRQLGKAAYLRELKQAAQHVREHFFELCVMCNSDGSRAAAEYTVLGVSLDGDEGGNYRLIGGAFFELHEGLIQRISQHRNLTHSLVPGLLSQSD